VGFAFALLVVAAVVAWWLKRPASSAEASPMFTTTVFRVVFRGGRVTKIEGRIPRATLSAFEDIASHAELNGEVRLTGIAELHFSDEIRPEIRQQLRNALLTSIHVH